MTAAACAGLLAAAGAATPAAADPANGPVDALVGDPAALVDPLIGTGSGGVTVGQVDTFPGATAPFGMLTFSPDTPSRPDGGGYNYADSSITGFSLTHMSGPGCGAFGDVPILPTVGPIGADPVNSTAAFSHAAERATPGAYSVTLNPAGSAPIKADLGATTRTGIGRFTYPAGTGSNVLFKMGDAQSGNTTADVHVLNDHEVAGTETAGQFCGSPGTYPLHFVASFSRPFAASGTWQTAPNGPSVFTAPTGDLPWTYHEVSSGGSPATIAPATTPDGQSAVAWHQDNALANTWIEATPPALHQGTGYEAGVTLRGTGTVYLNFYNGQQDVGGQPVKLTSTPVTLTVDAQIPTGSIGAPQFQVRTADAGPVDLVASAVSLRERSLVTTPGAAQAQGVGSGAWVTFDTTAQRDVTMKVAVSYVSEAGARANLAAENPGWSVDNVRRQTHGQWSALLNRIKIGGGTPAQRTEFYTALYHTLLEPNVFSDADRHYLGFDDKVHRTRPGETQYANFSGWDIYRTEVPLLALVAPDQTSQMMTSLLNDQAQGGWLPKWGFANTYTQVMNGDAADPILAEAYAFGATRFDTRAALAAMIKGASTVPTADQRGQGFYEERPGLPAYLSQGYVPNTAETDLSPVNNGASVTLEYAGADFAIAQFAQALGDRATATAYLRRSQNWTTQFNVDTGYLQPRDASGQFPEFDPTTDGMSNFGQSGFQEGNAAQYTWMVPQNLRGLITAMGGPAKATARLDTFFQQLNAGPNLPFEWAGNEPSFGTPWIYDYAGAPYKAEAMVHRLLTETYAATPGGEPGNDDLGAMCSWYVWSSLGLYPETPGAPVLVLGAPLFPHAVLDLPGAHQVVLNAPGASATTYVHQVSVDGRPWSPLWLPASLLIGRPHGVTRLDFAMVPREDRTWGAAAADAPPSYPAGPLQFPPGRKPTILVPTGPNLFGDTPTGQLAWQGPVQNGVGSVPGTLTPATTPQGASAAHWTETGAAPNTWIWVDPPAALPSGQYYQVSVTLQGTGTVYLDFWNGQQDLATATVVLTGTPQTLTLQGAVPADAGTHLQIRTGDSGPVDLYASAATVRLLTPQ